MPTEVLRFWTLSIVLFVSETQFRLYFKTQRFGDWILPQLHVKPQLGPIDRASPYLRI
jgi:hypothetical protein